MTSIDIKQEKGKLWGKKKKLQQSATLKKDLAAICQTAMFIIKKKKKITA